MKSSALIDPTGHYRYQLRRRWEPGNAVVAFIMLNPSTADSSKDDPTLRRCITFAQDWGFNALVVANLYALRTPNPDVLQGHPCPIGPDNDAHLRRVMLQCRCLVAAWGSHPMAKPRVPALISLLPETRSIMCLGYTSDNYPRHPLYMPRGTRPQPFLFRPNADAWPELPTTPDLFKEATA